MSAEELTIPVGKYDFIWAAHDRSTPKQDDNPPLVIMIHGFPGDSKSYGNVFDELSQRFVKDGAHSLRFDMRGCGKSNKGAQFFTLASAHDDCMAVFRWAEKIGYKKIYIVAEGLGAAVALTTLTGVVRPLVRRMIFLWPIFDPKKSWLMDVLPLAKEAEKKGHDHIVFDNTHIGLEFLREMSSYDLIPLLGRIQVPVQVHHGLDDKKAPPVQMDVLKAGASSKELEFITYDKGTHGLKDPQQRQTLLAETRNFVRKAP